ncbi:MAG TPA: LEA type 2 family protein [Polyangiaceae bacterium]
MRVQAAVLLLSCLSLAGCSKPEPPQVTARSARVTATAPTGVQLAVELDVHNPNSFPLLVESVEGTLSVAGGAEIGRGTARPGTDIPAQGAAPVTSQLTIPWSNLTALAPFALSGAPVPYTFEGRARVGGKRLNVEVPFTLRGELSREQLLQIGLQGLGPGSAPPP